MLTRPAIATALCGLLCLACASAEPDEAPRNSNAARRASAGSEAPAEPGASRPPLEELRDLLAALEAGDSPVGEARLRAAHYAEPDVEQARVDCLAAMEEIRAQRPPGELGIRCVARVEMLVQIYPDPQPASLEERMAEAVQQAPTPPPPPAGFAPSAEPRAFDGTLTDDDAVVPDDDSRYDEYEVDLRAGWRLTVHMQSTAFDTYLWLIGPAGNSLVQDDDGAEGTDSQLSYVVAHDGRYTIRANSYDGAGRGAYHLDVTIQR